MPLYQIVTVLSKPITKTNLKHRLSFISLINLGLALLSAAFLLYYVVLANGSSSSEYRISNLQTELNYYQDLNTALSEQRNEVDNSQAVSDFVARSGMIEDGNTLYVFENGNVALGSR